MWQITGGPPNCDATQMNPQTACDKTACDKLTQAEKDAYAFSNAMVGDYYRGIPGKYPNGPPYNKVDPVPWVPCLCACYLVAICSWLGGLLAVPPLRKFIEANYDQMQGVLAGFGSGAILSHVFLLRIWLATLMVGERVNKWDKDRWFVDGKSDLVQHSASITETRAILGWALCVIFGFLCPSVWDNVVALCASVCCSPANKGGEDEPAKEGEVIIPKSTWWEKLRMIVAVDYSNSIFHFWDGVFIASAWLTPGCEAAFGWKMFASLLIIRIPQGIADYTILTGPGCRMRWWVACCFNYADAMLLPLGAAATLSDAEAESPMNDDAYDVGSMQMFGIGLYLQLALVELLPRMLKNTLNWKWRCVATSAFLFGAIWVGLTLTLQEQCIPKLGLITNDGNTLEGQYWKEMSFPHQHYPDGIVTVAWSPR